MRRVILRRLVRIAFVLFPILVATPAAVYFYMPRQSRDDLETVIKQAGFDPLLPPSRLRGPGALYEVENGFYRKVCDADSQILKGKVHTSPIESKVGHRLQAGDFSLDGQLVGELNAELGSSQVTSIEYKLTDAAVSEIPMSDLAEIEDKLLRQKSCDETVQRLLKAHRKVCSGYAVLSATTSYKVNVASRFESGAGTHSEIMNTARRAIENHTRSKIQAKRTDELVGEDLDYGIQLSSLCITLNTATEPSVRTE